MRVLVTGATGLLGNNLVRHLVERGHDVVGLVRSPDKARWLLGDTGARWITGDMRDVGAFATSLDGIDAVFHTAAYFREYYQVGRDDGSLEEINVRGTRNLLEASERRGVRRFLHVGSSGMIGRKPDGSPGDEDTPPAPIAVSNGYFQSKVTTASFLRDFRSRRMDLIEILPGWMWGPRDAAPTAAGQLAIDFLAGRVPIVPTGGANIVDARDVAAAMVTACEKAPAGARYIVGGRHSTMAELLRQLEAVTGVPGPRRGLPHPLVWTFAALSELWSRLTGRPLLVSRQAIRILRAGLEVTSARAERELGVEFRPLTETLTDVIAWYRSEPSFAAAIARRGPPTRQPAAA